MNSTQQNDANGAPPLAESTGSASDHGLITWECIECQQLGATYCCRISVDIGQGDNYALVCPQRCPWFDGCISDWYRVSEPNTQGQPRREEERT